MRVLLQRVSAASVHIAGQPVSEIGPGLLLFVGIAQGDSMDTVARLAERVVGYRVFADSEGKMNLDVREAGGELLVVSQFTLAADTRRGRRPGFGPAAAPDNAKVLYQAFLSALTSALDETGVPVRSGVFAADMQVQLINDGPVTFLLEAT